MTCGLERSPTWSFLLLFLHFHKSTSVFFIFTLGPGNSLSFHVIQSGLKLGPWTVLNSWSSDVTKSSPHFGPVGWGSSSCLVVHFLFFKFLSLFLAISRGGQRCLWVRQWNFSAFRFVCESKRDYETSVYCNYIQQLQDCQGHISCLCSSTNITFLIL